jgi:hypothetical protein
VADRATLLFAAFSLLAAVNRRWLVAGVIATVGTAEHPTLIAAIGALGIVALREIWTRRDWRSLIAPALAPLGVLSFFGPARP